MIDTDFEPISDAFVRATLFPRDGSCGAEPLAEVQANLNEAGSYSETFEFEGLEGFAACLSVEAVPFQDSPWIGQSVSGVGVQVRPTSQGIEIVVTDFVLERDPDS